MDPPDLPDQPGLPGLPGRTNGIDALAGIGTGATDDAYAAAHRIRGFQNAGNKYRNNTVGDQGRAHFGDNHTYVDVSKMGGDALQLLEPVSEARYDSQHNESRHRQCMSGTREHILEHVRAWAEEKHGSPFFWIAGIAGTGKSTLAMTLASMLQENHLLASFFFDRGTASMASARRMLPSLAHQLGLKSPQVKAELLKVICQEPDIARLSTHRQLNDLLLRPFDAPGAPRAILVIDALDECKEIGEVTRFLQLLSKIEDLQCLNLRFLLTSRPEFRIEGSFENIKPFRELVLHESNRADVNRDIQTYLESEFASIRRNRLLPNEWPSGDQILSLVERSEGLFMFPAMVCEYVNGSIAKSPMSRLHEVLQHTQGQRDASKALDQMYTLVLCEAFRSSDESHECLEVDQDFQEVVGSLIIAFNNLPIDAFADLVNVELDILQGILIPLRAVIYVTKDDKRLVRIIHESFRDYLLDKSRCMDSALSVVSEAAHTNLATCCFRIMKEQLRVDICNLRSSTDGIWSEKDVNTHVSPALQYASRFWIKHLVLSASPWSPALHDFFRRDALMWAEILGLINGVPEVVSSLLDLEVRFASAEATTDETSAFIYDLRRFLTAQQGGLTGDPLQAYLGARHFTPSQSFLRTVCTRLPSQKVHAEVSQDNAWDYSHGSRDFDCLSEAVCFSPDGFYLAAITGDRLRSEAPRDFAWEDQPPRDGRLDGIHTGRMLTVWEVATSRLVQSFDGRRSLVGSVAFSPDSVLLACSADDNKILLWSIIASCQRHALTGHTECVLRVAFDKLGSKVVTSSWDMTIRVWDVITGHCKLVVSQQDEPGLFRPIFALGQATLITGGGSGTLKIWCLRKCRDLQTLEGHTSGINDLAVSPSGTLLASAAFDQTVRLWNLDNFQCLHILGPHLGSVGSVAFSSDSCIIAACSRSKAPASQWDCHYEVKLWSSDKGDCLQSYKSIGSEMSLQFSNVGNLLISKTSTHGIEVRNVGTGTSNGVVQTLKAPWATCMALAPDQPLFAVGSSDLRLEEIAPAATALPGANVSQLQTPVSAMAISLDGALASVGFEDGSIQILDMNLGRVLGSTSGHENPVECMAFAADGTRIVTTTSDDILKLWRSPTCEFLHTGHFVGSSSGKKDVEHPGSAIDSPVSSYRVEENAHRKRSNSKRPLSYEAPLSGSRVEIPIQEAVNPFLASHDKLRETRILTHETDEQWVRVKESAKRLKMDSLSAVGADRGNATNARNEDDHTVKAANDDPTADSAPNSPEAQAQQSEVTASIGLHTQADMDYPREVRWASGTTIECRGKDNSTIVWNLVSNICETSSKPWKPGELRSKHRATSATGSQGLNYDAGWIQNNSRKLLWLPVAFRPGERRGDVFWRGSGDSILIYSRFGKRTFVSLSESHT